MLNRTNSQPVGAFGQQAAPRSETSHEEDFPRAALVLTFAATAAAPAMAEQFPNPFSQR
jgi:hypothetical protein